MTNNEDFFAFAYPAFVISSVMISIIPAYIASKKNKNFWLWWFSTASVFTILLFVLIRVQAFSQLIYLLAVVPIASILAFSSRPLLVPKLKISKDVLFFLSILLVLLIFAFALYFYLLSPKRNFLGDIEKVYFVNLGVMILMACIGFASFIFTVSERRVREIIGGVICTAVLTLPIFFDPSRAYTLILIPGRLFGKDLLFGPVVTDLINMPIAGVFVLVGICSGCAAFAIILDDRFGIVNRVAYVILTTLKKVVFNVPSIRLSKNPFLSSVILLGFILFGLFIINFELGEAWIFLIPLIYLCWVVPLVIVGFAGVLLSSIVIVKSINQGKSPFVAVILLCGLLAGWKTANTHFFVAWLGLPGTLLMAYGMTTGFISLVLWVVSDILGSRHVENL